jgi:ParB family chromosome partitioning protein
MTPPVEPANLGSVTQKGDRKRRLGKGLNALLGDAHHEFPVSSTPAEGPVNDENKQGFRLIATAKISPLSNQPRTQFDEAALEELAASIAKRGVIQPIIVTHDGPDRFRLVAGERRWRAAQRAQLHEIPAIVRELDAQDVYALSLIENLQREDLNPLEEARAYRRLHEDEGLTQAEIADAVGKSRSHIANLLRLLQLPRGVQAMVEAGALDMGHARALIGSENAEEHARLVIEKGLSVRQVEQLMRKPARTGGGRKPAEGHSTQTDDDIAVIQAQLEEFLGLPVRIRVERDPSKGSVTINYRTLDQLDLLCQRLTGGGL